MHKELLELFPVALLTFLIMCPQGESSGYYMNSSTPQWLSVN